MKDFLKACKLYVNVLYTPVFRVISILVMSIGVFEAFFLSSPKSSDDYFKKIILISIFHFGILIRNIYIDLLHPKIFYSVKFAKKYNTIVPLLTTASVSIIYDVILFVVSAINLGLTFATDLMIVNAAVTIIACYFSIPSDLRNDYLGVLPSACVIVILNARREIHPDLMGYGFSLYTDILITLGIYIAGCFVLIAVSELWWKKRKI